MGNHTMWSVAAAVSVCVFVNVRTAEAVSPLQTVTFDVLGDTRLDSFDVDENFGDSSSLKFVVNEPGDASVVRSVIAFPNDALAWELPENTDLVSVTVWLTHYSGTAMILGDRTLALHPLTQGFSEYDATWNTWDGTQTWTTAGGDYDAGTSVTGVPDSVSSPTAYSWDITSLWDFDPDGLWADGALLKFGSEDPNGIVDYVKASFYSKDHSSGQAPYIEFAYIVPEPGSLSILALLGGLVAAARRHI